MASEAQFYRDLRLWLEALDYEDLNLGSESWTEAIAIIGGHLHDFGMDAANAAYLIVAAETRVTTISAVAEQDIYRSTSTLAQLRGAELVTNINTQARESIRDAIAASTRGGLTRSETDKLIRAVVGPTRPQSRAIIRAYERKLADELSRGTSRAKAIERAQRRADVRYRASVRSRARTIRRTEIRYAQERARVQGWRNAARDGLMPPNARRVWLTADPCPICVDLEGQSVPWDQPFDEVGEPPAHPNCVCTTFLEFPPLS